MDNNPVGVHSEPSSIALLSLDQWQSFVDNHKNSTVFHHRNWLELLREQYGYEVQIPALILNHRVVVAIPFLRTRNLRGAKKLISLPFTDYLPILSEQNEVVPAFCQRIKQEFGGRFSAIVVRGDTTIDDLNNESPHVRHELATHKSMDELEQSFDSSIKRNLRKGQRLSLDFQKRDDREAIDIFYRLHLLTRKKLGVPIQAKRYFIRLHEKLLQPGLGCVGVVSKDHVPLAAVVLLGFNGRLIYKYAASDPAALDVRPNDWLVYHSIRMAAEEGYRCFDFGISDRQQDGLRRFKKKWGAVESDIYYSYLIGKPKPNGSPSRAFRFASAVIKSSPTVVCRAIGNAFYKYSQ